MNECEYYAELISPYYDGELSEAEADALSAHIKECKDCRKLFEAFSTLSDIVDDSLIAPPEALCDNIMREVHLINKSRKQRLFKSLSSLAACAVLVVISAFAFKPSNPVSNETAPMMYARSTAIEAAPAVAIAEDSVSTAENAINEVLITSHSYQEVLDILAIQEALADVPEYRDTLKLCFEDKSEIVLYISAEDIYTYTDRWHKAGINITELSQLLNFSYFN